MTFGPIRKLRLAEQVASSIRDAIFSGDLSPGSALPPERELAERFGVNRSSVREALHRLDAWGLIDVRHGGLTRVRNALTSMGVHLLPYLLMPGGQLDTDVLGDLLVLRVQLLGWTAELASQHSVPARAVDALEAILDDMRRCDDPETLQQLDFAFFDQMVESGGNRVLRLIVNAIREVYLKNRKLFVALYAKPQFTLEHHERAMACIKEHDGDGARVAMQAFGALAPGAGGAK